MREQNQVVKFVELFLKLRKKPDNKFLNPISNLLGLLSIFIGITGIILAYLSYPNFIPYGPYDPRVRMVSDLGTPWLSSGYMYFNIAFFLCGILALPFYVYLWKVFKKGNSNERLTKFAFRLSLVSSACLSLVGVTLASSRYLLDPIFIVHGTFALISFASISISCLIYSAKMLHDERFYKIHAYFGFILPVFPILFYITWQPILEWTSVIMLGVWLLVMAIYVLYKKL